MFEKKVVWITGGGSGIGKAMAIEFAKTGAAVAISGRRKEQLEKLVKEQKRNGLSLHVYPCDVSDLKAVTNTSERIVQELGQLDVAVANAGYSVTVPFDKMTPEEFKRQMDTNLFGATWTLKAALPHVKKTKGSLVVVSSVAGKLGVKNQTAYCASKFAVTGLCNALYLELKSAGVSVTNIMPGLIESDIVKVDNLGHFHPERTDKRPAQPLIWKADRAAKAMVKAIYKRKRQAVITGHGKVGVFLANHCESFLYWLMTAFKIHKK